MGDAKIRDVAQKKVRKTSGKILRAVFILGISEAFDTNNTNIYRRRRCLYRLTVFGKNCKQKTVGISFGLILDLDIIFVVLTYKQID